MRLNVLLLVQDALVAPQVAAARLLALMDATDVQVDALIRVVDVLDVREDVDLYARADVMDVQVVVHQVVEDVVQDALVVLDALAALLHVKLLLTQVDA